MALMSSSSYPVRGLSERGVRPRLGLASRARLTAAVTAGRLAAAASRLAGKGSGASIRGQVLTRIDPGAFAKLLAGRRIVCVTGTNGKTTSTHLITAAVKAALGVDADRAATNADGANLHYGIASALGEHPEADIALLETDERVVADVIKHGKPEVLVLLNFSRDQLDRHHEIKALGRNWRIALEQAGQDGPVVVANADDPLITWAAQTAKQVIWVDTDTAWTQDAALCPGCGALLTHTDGRWDCPSCELTQHEGDWHVQGDQIVAPDGTVLDPDLQVPGKFNVSNAACGLAAAALLGIDAETALRGMRTVTSPAGRFATTEISGSTCRLLLAKNPAGWAEALPLAQTDTVVLAIDSAAADGRDVSWLWDVDYEQLADPDRPARVVVATGPRAQDLAVRLTYAGVPHRVENDLGAALAGHAEPVDVIATYTPFQRLRKMGGLA